VREIIEGIVRDEDGMGRLAAPAHNSNGGHKVICPFFDDVEWGGVSCSIPYDASCHSLHVSYLLLAGRNAVFTVRGRWGNGRNRFAYCP